MDRLAPMASMRQQLWPNLWIATGSRSAVGYTPMASMRHLKSRWTSSLTWGLPVDRALLRRTLFGVHASHLDIFMHVLLFT